MILHEITFCEIFLFYLKKEKIFLLQIKKIEVFTKIIKKMVINYTSIG